MILTGEHFRIIKEAGEKNSHFKMLELNSDHFERGLKAKTLNNIFQLTTTYKKVHVQQ